MGLLGDYTSEIVQGMAEIFWGDAWATWMEENGRSGELSGKEITEIMPPIPDRVYNFCYRMLGRIEELNNNDEFILLSMAVGADYNAGNLKSITPLPKEYTYSFGNYLAHGCLGSGVSWFDDHAEFPIKFPYTESYIYGEELR